MIVGNAVREIAPHGNVGLHEPVLGETEKLALIECIESGFVSSVGQFVNQFEKDLAEFTGSTYVVATVNGTAALQVCLRACGVERGDEVLLPALTFIATANAVSYLGAVPHFVDVDFETLCVSPTKLHTYLAEIAVIRRGECFNRLTGRRIKALVPVHVFGHPADMRPLSVIAETFNIALVEDAAESLGSRYREVHTGTVGRCSAVSFNGNKIITTGGGGAILTNDRDIAALARHLTTTAKTPHRWNYNHDMLGYNFRMPNINAAIGVSQLRRIDEFIRNKRVLTKFYENRIGSHDGLRIQLEPNYGVSNYWLQAVRLQSEARGELERIIGELNDLGIGARPLWSLASTSPMYRDCPSMPLIESMRCVDSIMNIPSNIIVPGGVSVH
jgi:perosamine synthetase